MATVGDILNNINGLLSTRANSGNDELNSISEPIIGPYFYKQFRSIMNLIGLPRNVHSHQKEWQSDQLCQQSTSLPSTSSSTGYIESTSYLNPCEMENLTADGLSNYLEKCETLMDFAWEYLNIGHWKSVKIDFRYFYGYVCLGKVILKLRQICLLSDHEESHENEDELKEEVENFMEFDRFTLNRTEKEKNLLLPKGLDLESLQLLIKVCDLACIMCPPIMNGITSEIANKLHQLIAPCYSLKWKTLSDSIKSRQQFLITPIDPAKRIESIYCPSLETFQQSYLQLEKPCIITGAMDHWPACNPQSGHQWSLEYLLNQIGSRTVAVEIGSNYTDSEWSQNLMTVDSFIDKHWVDGPNKGYVAQQELFRQCTELAADFSIPDYCGLPRQFDDDTINSLGNIVTNGWFGPWGTVSPLHYDPYDNLLAQVVGRKYIRLYSSSIEPRSLYPFSDFLLSNTSQVDVDSVDHIRFPLFTSLPYLECCLEQGQILFIPKGYWHFVKSLSISFSINFWWT